MFGETMAKISDVLKTRLTASSTGVQDKRRGGGGGVLVDPESALKAAQEAAPLMTGERAMKLAQEVMVRQ
jgi:transcriptional regulator CtsR